MKCDCKDCAFRGMELCEHRRLTDAAARYRATIQEAKDRLRYYFNSFSGQDFSDPHIQNVYDVLCRDDEN